MNGSVTIPPPPPGMNYIAMIRPSLNFLLIVTFMASITVVVMLMLVLFSTQKTRSQPIFWLDIFACCLGILVAILNIITQISGILSPLVGITRQMFLSLQAVVIIAPLLIDSVLLVRVLAFYPSHKTTWMELAKVLAFPILVKAGRLSMEITYMVKFDQAMKEFQTVVITPQLMWFQDPYAVTDWTLQVFDNSYCSLFFVYKLRLFDKAGRSGWAMRHPTVLSRFRGMFYIALGNFIFPIAINIAQIILVVSDRSFLNGGYLQLVNIYISIIGLVFATVWTTGHRRNSNLSADEGSSWNQQPFDSTGKSLRAGKVNLRLVQQTTLQSDATASDEVPVQCIQLSEDFEMGDAKSAEPASLQY